MSAPFVALGIDPGSSNPGSALLGRSDQRWTVMRLPVLKSLDDLAQELAEIHHLGIEVHACCVEDVAWSLHAKEQGHGSGKILDAVGQARVFAAIHRIPLLTVTGAQWRRVATGSSRATKESAREVVSRRVLGWPKGRVSKNRSDAAAIAMCGGMTEAQLRLLVAARRARR